MKNYNHVVLRTVLQGENKTQENMFDSENASIRDVKNISTQFNNTHVFDFFWLVLGKEIIHPQKLCDSKLFDSVLEFETARASMPPVLKDYSQIFADSLKN